MVASIVIVVYMMRELAILKTPAEVGASHEDCRAALF
jgi:hypothetical protein